MQRGCQDSLELPRTRLCNAGTVTGRRAAAPTPRRWPHPSAGLVRLCWPLPGDRGDRGISPSGPGLEWAFPESVCAHFGRQTDGGDRGTLPAEGAERGRRPWRPLRIAALSHPCPIRGPLNSQAKVFWLMFLAFRSDVGELCTQGTVWKI